MQETLLAQAKVTGWRGVINGLRIIQLRRRGPVYVSRIVGQAALLTLHNSLGIRFIRVLVWIIVGRWWELQLGLPYPIDETLVTQGTVTGTIANCNEQRYHQCNHLVVGQCGRFLTIKVPVGLQCVVFQPPVIILFLSSSPVIELGTGRALTALIRVVGFRCSLIVCRLRCSSYVGEKLQEVWRILFQQSAFLSTTISTPESCDLPAPPTPLSTHPSIVINS